MIGVVTGVSALVHIYSIGYMADDPAKARFFAYLNLFTFMMLILVTANNLVQLFVGWEGVGLSSYLLIGFWYDKISAGGAAMKAFLVNRVGDIGLALGIFACFILFDTVNFDLMFRQVELVSNADLRIFGHRLPLIELAGILLIIGAMGKSAQLGLHTWLPDAMEGPTPVSALIHAATMVTAGVFLIARMSPLFEMADTARMLIVAIGGITALSGAMMAMAQYDIKRVIAYSTMSQLGYMFFACGVGAYSAGMFHLTTHAFFKALLFLGAGSVIHAVHGEQDMRKLGGLWKKIPITYGMIWIGSLAIAGIPFFAGYYSKDMVLEASFAHAGDLSRIVYWTGVLVAGMTAFYSWRLIYMTFHGVRSDHMGDDPHEAPVSMILPMAILAGGSIIAGNLLEPFFVGDQRAEFWGPTIAVVGQDIIDAAHHIPKWAVKMPLIFSLAGIILATIVYQFTNLAESLKAVFSILHHWMKNRLYIDDLYEKTIIQPLLKLGQIFAGPVERGLIDRFGPNGIASGSGILAVLLAKLQSGYLYHYVFALLIGLAILLGYLLGGIYVG
jgi:NADH-quinone oxidoreductase subunit L